MNFEFKSQIMVFSTSKQASSPKLPADRARGVTFPIGRLGVKIKQTYQVHSMEFIEKICLEESKRLHIDSNCIFLISQSEMKFIKISTF